MELQIIEESEELTHVALSGRLDLTGVQEVEKKFTSYTVTRRKPVIVDMSEVTFLSSLGIRMLMSCAKNLNRVNAKLVLLNPQELVTNVIKSVNLEEIIPVVSSRDEAVKYFNVS